MVLKLKLVVHGGMAVAPEPEGEVPLAWKIPALVKVKPFALVMVLLIAELPTTFLK